jgi:hypothetical protein
MTLAYGLPPMLTFSTCKEINGLSEKRWTAVEKIFEIDFFFIFTLYPGGTRTHGNNL